LPGDLTPQHAAAEIASDPAERREHLLGDVAKVGIGILERRLSPPHANDHDGLTGFAAPSPATVVHSRTRQRITRPFTT